MEGKVRRPRLLTDAVDVLPQSTPTRMLSASSCKVSVTGQSDALGISSLLGKSHRSWFRETTREPHASRSSRPKVQSPEQKRNVSICCVDLKSRLIYKSTMDIPRRIVAIELEPCPVDHQDAGRGVRLFRRPVHRPWVACKNRNKCDQKPGGSIFRFETQNFPSEPVCYAKSTVQPRSLLIGTPTCRLFAQRSSQSEYPS